VSSKSYTQIRQTDPRAAGPVAGLRPDNRAGVRGVGQPEPAIATLHRYASEPTTPRVGEGFSLGQPKPIAVAGSKGGRFGGPNPVVVGRVQAATGALGARPDNRAGILGEPTPTVAQQSSSAGNGFDWADYGIGMGGGIGAAALLLGMALALRHRGQHKVALKSA